MNEPDNVDALIEVALENQPLAPLPPGFVRATMARLASPVRFRLHFLDVALPFGFSMLLIPLFVLYLWLRGIIALAWLPVPALPAASFAGISWTAVLFLIILAELSLLLAGLMGDVMRET